MTLHWGYYSPPPIDTPEPKQLAGITMLQLKAWQDYAEHWPWSTDEKCYKCGDCGALIHQLFDGMGHKYDLAGVDLFALEVAHLRRRHLDKEAEVYEKAGITI